MALGWLRRKQKQILIPLTVVVIASFVLFMGGGKVSLFGARGGGVVAIVDGRKITRMEQARLRRQLILLGGAYGLPGRDPRDVYRHLIRARAAERAGVVVSSDELRDEIVEIMSSPAWIGAKDFTAQEYAGELADRGIPVAKFEELVRGSVAARTLAQVTTSTAYVTEEEKYLAYCRERDKVRLRYRDFPVEERLKDVKEPTDEEIGTYYEEHEKFDPEDERALATEPKVAIEYVLADEAGARALLRASRAVRALGGRETLAGRPGALADAVLSGALALVRNEELKGAYEARKKTKFLIEAEEKKEQKEKEKKEEEGGEEPTAESAEPKPDEERPEEPAPGAEGPPAGEEGPRYRPFKEVRAELEKELDETLLGRMAGEEVSSFRRRLRERDTVLTQLGALALGALSWAGDLAAATGAAVRSGIDLATAAEEAGLVHGVTPLAEVEKLDKMEPLGDLEGLADNALWRAMEGKGDVLSGPWKVENGYVSWRVSEYVPARKLKLDECRDLVRDRIKRRRAAELAREAARELKEKLEDLEEGKSAEQLGLERTGLLKATEPEALLFALLSKGEVSDPVPLDEEGRPLEGLGREGEEELVHRKAARFRVAVLEERVSPSREEFGKDEAWGRSWRARELEYVTRLYFYRHWFDKVRDMVRLRWISSPEIERE